MQHTQHYHYQARAIKKESPNEGTETGLQETATVNESGLYKKRIPE